MKLNLYSETLLKLYHKYFKRNHMFKIGFKGSLSLKQNSSFFFKSVKIKHRNKVRENIKKKNSSNKKRGRREPSNCVMIK